MMAALYLPMDSWTTGPRITPPRPVRTARLSKHFALSARCRPLAMLAEEVRPGSLILVRHGQSTWNDENRFTGWANVPLNDKGREDAQDAADILLSEEALHIDVCYTSVLRRSVDTAKVILDAWEQAGHQRPETFARWRLNERHYGMLTGLNKREALGMFSKSELRHWRSSFEGKPPPMEPDHRHYSRTKERYELLLSARTQRKHEPKMTVLRQSDVPLTESLADTCRRVGSLWEDELLPQVRNGRNVLVVGHANCLRALISCIQGNLSDEHLPSLGVPNAVPLVYDFDTSGKVVTGLPDRCYIRPLDAHYLGEACLLFNEIDADGSGAIDASEFDGSEFCLVAWDDLDLDLDKLTGLTDNCGERLLQEADNNNDGAVDFNEYMNWWGRLDEKPYTRGPKTPRPKSYRDT
jgi:2,3-bisphosphoglycerate-dependent phosphoglycerate mutase